MQPSREKGRIEVGPAGTRGSVAKRPGLGVRPTASKCLFCLEAYV